MTYPDGIMLQHACLLHMHDGRSTETDLEIRRQNKISGNYEEILFKVAMKLKRTESKQEKKHILLDVYKVNDIKIINNMSSYLPDNRADVCRVGTHHKESCVPKPRISAGWSAKPGQHKN